MLWLNLPCSSLVRWTLKGFGFLASVLSIVIRPTHKLSCEEKRPYSRARRLHRALLIGISHLDGLYVVQLLLCRMVFVKQYWI